LNPTLSASDPSASTHGNDGSSGIVNPYASGTARSTSCSLLVERDEEWGVPVHDERALFEFLVLNGAQAGLSWMTILRKRDAYRRAFDRFDPRKVARYDGRKVAALLADAGIVRNRAKIGSAIKNAKAFLDVQAEFGSFDAYQWRFVDGRPVQNRWRAVGEIPLAQHSPTR
jgi:DNA-3-methyladenine glycosylase I